MGAVAYLINQYPKVSHSFIRRELIALEEAGNDVVRVALRGWDADVVDPVDKQELERTHYLLQHGVKRLLSDVVNVLRQRPSSFLKALALTVRVGWRADRPLPYHFIYLAEACALLQLCQARGVSHVHAHFGTNPAEVVMLCRALGGPKYSFTVHGPEEFDRPVALKLREKIEQSAFVVAISSFGRSQLSRWVGHEQWSKIREVHCGLDAEFLDAPVGELTTQPRFVCVGRLCEQKGQLLLIEALARLRERGHAPELVLAGDGDMRSEVEALIAQHGLTEQVTITGWISSAQVAEQLKAARAMVLPSFAEGLPVVIMEAMAIGCPVISTYIAGIPELVKSGVNGWLVPAGSIEALVDAMQTVLETDNAQLQSMVDAARVSVRTQHNIAVEAGKLATAFAQQEGAV